MKEKWFARIEHINIMGDNIYDQNTANISLCAHKHFWEVYKLYNISSQAAYRLILSSFQHFASSIQINMDRIASMLDPYIRMNMQTKWHARAHTYIIFWERTIWTIVYEQSTFPN